jgi:ferredoxin-NADP reductase
MGEMMKGMGTPPLKELYPSLMALPDEVTPEERAAIEQLAHERMKAGTALLSSGLEKLSNSTSDEDYAAMQQATGQMREGLAEFEAGIAARRVLAEGKAPRNLALDWFKREMNLASPVPPEEPRTLLGIKPIHLFTMLLLIAFALAMVAMYFFKMRRAAALFGRVGPDKNPPPGTSPPVAGGPGPPAPPAGTSGLAQPTPPPPSAEAPAEKSPVPNPPPAAPGAGTPAASTPPPEGSSAFPVPAAPAADKPAAPSAARASPASPAASGDGNTAKIAGRADELWKARGRPMGSPKIDWLRAEEELAKSAGKAPATPPPASEATSGAPVTANWRGQLRIASITTETPSVKTFRLVPSSNDRLLPFTFLPGQFLNVAFWIGGAKMNRSYSISSSPNEREHVDLTIRREPRGAVSRHLHDLLRVGDLFEIDGPVGKFTFTGTEADSIVLLSGGVGITPLMSISRYLTERSWPGDIYFVYTCRTPADFIFADKFPELQRRNPRLHVAVTVSQPEGTDWKGASGRITKEWLTQTVPDLAARRTQLCGPPPMMDSMKAMFTELGISQDHLKTETFGAVKPAPAAPGTAKAKGPATGPQVTFSKNNKSAKIRLDLQTGDSPPKQSILELSEELSIGIEFSCRVGTCGVCKTKMTAGEVDQEVQDALDDNDKAKGIILACQAKPKGDVTVEA